MDDYILAILMGLWQQKAVGVKAVMTEVGPPNLKRHSVCLWDLA